VLYVARHAESAWLLDKRSQFQSILADAQAGKFGVLIVDRMNRFSRSEDLSDPILVMRHLRDAGVRVSFSDKEYGDGMLGQMQQFLELFASGTEQKSRREASYWGRVGRVKKGYPIPTRRASYGYIWKPALDGQPKKTELMQDPGAAQAVVKRIWQYFLHYTPTLAHPRPTLHGLKTLLNTELVPPPTVYHNVADHTHTRRNVWTTATLQKLLHNGVYWGEPRPALSASKYPERQAPVQLPAYGPPYVTPQEAARVHAILRQNGEHGGRPRGRDYGTLLHGGLLVCAYCGHSMHPMGVGRRLPDGTKPIRYRCSEQTNHGSRVCKGTNISAATLDWAVLVTLQDNLRRGTFLDRLFAAWEADETTAQAQVRVAQAAYADAQEQVASLVASSARHAPTTPTWAAIQLQLDQLNALVPRLHARVLAAQNDVAKVRGNAALRNELQEWFTAWLDGFYMLPIPRQREFLFAIHAQVTLWRASDRTPRAELLIGVPTDVLMLPPAPDITVAADGWHIPLNIAQGLRYALVAREAADLLPETPEGAARKAAWAQASAADVLAAVQAELEEPAFVPTEYADGTERSNSQTT
jgi:hypothetical protein